MNMKPKLLLLIAACLMAPLTFTLIQTGCTTSQQRVAYNTLYTIEKGTTSAYDAFLDQVVSRKVSMLRVPPVAKAYNDFQAGMAVAVAAAQYNWQAPAPTNVTALATVVINSIAEAQH